MDIYIKSFNRPYLLHKCIASIYHFLKEFDGRIVVLDDGTPQIYLDKIVVLFPNITIVKSPYYEQKSKAISLNQIPENVIPANFWRNEVLKGSENFILLEDDMWFVQPFNYKNFVNDVYSLKMDMIKFMWMKNSKLISNNIIQKAEYFNIVQPKVLTKNPFLFDAVYNTNKIKLKSFAELFFNTNQKILNYYQMFIVAGGVFSKKYYETCWQNNQNKVDELQQIFNLLKSKKSFNLGNSNKELLQTTLISKASNNGDKTTFSLNEFNKNLNNYWLGLSNVYYSFNEDFSLFFIKKALESSKVTFEDWEKWYQKIKQPYTEMGCKLD